MSQDTSSLVPPPGEMDFYIVRHGQTICNETHTVQGFLDSPLTARGIAQAKQAGKGLEHIPFAAAFSSDLGRQKDTAGHILAENRHPAPALEEVYGLREWCMGGFEGGSIRELWEPVFREYNLPGDNPAAAFQALIAAAGLGGIADAVARHDASGKAERFETIAARIREAVSHIVAVSLAKGGGNVLIVSSGMAIRTLLHLYVPDAPEDMTIPNCSLSILRHANGKFTLLKAGDTDYLGRTADREDAGATV